MLEPRLSKFGRFLQSSLGWPLRNLLRRRIAWLQQVSDGTNLGAGDLFTQQGWVILPKDAEEMALRLPEMLAVAQVLEGKAGWAGPSDVLAWLPEFHETRDRLAIPTSFAALKSFASSNPQLVRNWSWWLGGQPWINGLLAFGWLGNQGRIALQGECLDIPNLRIALGAKEGESYAMRTAVQLFRKDHLAEKTSDPVKNKGSVVLALPDVSPESRTFRTWALFVQSLAAKERIIIACRSQWKDKVALVLGNPGFGIQVEVIENTQQCERIAKTCRIWVGEPSAALVRATQLGCMGVLLQAKLPQRYGALKNVRCVGSIKSIANPSQILSP